MNIQTYENVEKYLGAGLIVWKGRVEISFEPRRNTYTLTAKPDHAWLRNLKKERKLGVTYWDAENVRIAAFAGQDDCFVDEDQPGKGWKIWAYNYNALITVLQHLDESALPKYPVINGIKTW
jgi:hypothetical protein